MRTLPNRWPRSASRGDYAATCDIDGSRWMRSQLRFNGDGWLLCPRCWERGPGELSEANAARAQNMRPVEPGDGGSIETDTPYEVATPVYALPTDGLTHLWQISADTVHTSGSALTSLDAVVGGLTLTTTQGTVNYTASSAVFSGRPTITLVGGATNPRLQRSTATTVYQPQYDGSGGSTVIVGRWTGADGLQFSIFGSPVGATLVQWRLAQSGTIASYRVNQTNLVPVMTATYRPPLVFPAVLVGTFGGNEGRLYYNGRLVAAAPRVAEPAAGDAAIFRLSSNTAGTEGELAVLGLYSHVLTPNEIRAIQDYAQDHYGVVP